MNEVYTSFFIIYGLDYFFSLVFSFIFMEYYTNKKVNRFVYIFCYGLLFGNFLLMLTISYEIMYRQLSKYYKKSNHDLIGAEEILSLNYKIAFFFILTANRYINPFARHFFQSGEFTFCGKVRESIKKGLIEFLIFNLIFIIIMIISQNVAIALFITFSLFTIIGALIFLGHSMITIPQKLKIHSDINLSIEYYEYKANKNIRELNKNHEKIITIYYQCQKTFEYIENIENFLNNEENKDDDIEDLKTEEEKEEEKNEDNQENDNINENQENIDINENNNINEDENQQNKENTSNNKNEEEKIKKNKEKEEKKIKKDYKKHKSIIKDKERVNDVFKFSQELLENYKINLREKKDEKPLKKYKNIVNANFELMLADREIERITENIIEIYNGWAFKKGISLELNKDNNNEKNFLVEEREDGFIPPNNISMKKIQFYKKYNKCIYMSLMILFIFLDILIIFQEITLCLPVNISIFSYIFKNIGNPVAIHILFIIIAGLFYIFAIYSFSKIKSIGIKYTISGVKKTNTLGILMFCQRLSTISYPIAMNTILMIFHKNIDDDENNNSIIEKNYGDTINSSFYYIVSGFIPLLLIIILIFDYFNLCGRMCKKKQKNQSFYLKNEIREKKIRNGRNYLMKLNKDNLISLENLV